MREAEAEYRALGFDTLPLRPDSKAPLSKGWPQRPPDDMWRDAPPDALLGVRAGGSAQVAFLDCDEKTKPGTFANASRWLVGLGYDPEADVPVVQTASGVGRHVWLRFEGALPGNYRTLDSAFGAGELRYGPGSFVVAPPSVIDGNAYALVSGTFWRLPRVELRDILPLLRKKSLEQLPERAVLRPIPRNAQMLLNGTGTAKYPSRSEVECAIVVSLVNVGYDFDSILYLFRNHPAAGKFAELHVESEANAIRWLRQTFDKAAHWARSHTSPGRQSAQSALDWAEASPWPGRTGPYDQAVFEAHCKIAWKSGATVYAASARVLAEAAGTISMTATNATHRLIEAGLLKLVIPSVADQAAQYELIVPNYTTSSQTVCGEVYQVCPATPRVEHDAFRYRGLGKSAAEVYAALAKGPLTEGELVERTGRSLKTVRRVLKKMTSIVDRVTGEVVHMVERHGDAWTALRVDLDHVAEVLGTSGTGQRQKERHIKEREGFRRVLSAYRPGKRQVRGS